MYESIVLTTIIKYVLLFSVTICLVGGVVFIVLHSASLSFLEVGHLYIILLLTLLDMVSTKSKFGHRTNSGFPFIFVIGVLPL